METLSGATTVEITLEKALMKTYAMSRLLSRGQVTRPILATLASNLLCLCIARPRRQAESRAEAWNGWRPETSGAVQCTAVAVAAV